MNPANGHESECLCEWCMAVQRHKRVEALRQERVRRYQPTAADLRATAAWERRHSTKLNLKVRRKEECSTCHRTVLVRNDGTFYAHGWRMTSDGYPTDYCPQIRPEEVYEQVREG